MLSHVFEVGVAHIFDGKDENVRIFVDGGVDGGEEGFAALFGGLLLDDRSVNDAVSLGLGHCGGGGGVCDVACDVIDGVGEEFVVLGAFARAQVALSSKFQCTDPIGVPYR